MKAKILLLIIVLLGSGCISSSSEAPSAQETFKDLSNLGRVSTYSVKYSLTGSGTDYSRVNISASKFQEGEKYEISRETPGGDRVTRIYMIENRTVSCSAGLVGTYTSCSLEGDEALYKMLQVSKWNPQALKLSTTKNIKGRNCQQFIARPQITRKLGLEQQPENTLLKFCIDTEKGYTAHLQVENRQNNETVLEFNTEKIETNLDQGLELPRSVAIISHCTDSYEIDLIPLEDVETAQITLNNYTETVELPERFQKGIYSVPEKSIQTGINDITVKAGDTTQNSTCYRRPSR